MGNDNGEFIEQQSGVATTTTEAIEKARSEYSQEWEKLEKESQGSKVDNENIEDLPPDKKNGASDDNIIDTVKSKKYGSIESMEKALDDTKAYAHRLENERSELRKKLEEAEKGKATQAEVEQAKKDVQKAENDLDAVKAKVYEDYPEFQALIDPILELNKTLENKIQSLESQRTKSEEKDQKQKLIDDFNENIKPDVLKVHGDFDSIVQSEDYWKWAEKQRPSLKTAAMDSPDPQDIIWAITEFKKDNARQEVPGIENKEKDDRGKRLKNSQTLRGGSTSFPTKSDKDKDPNDYAGGWEESGEILKKQGIGTG